MIHSSYCVWTGITGRTGMVHDNSCPKSLSRSALQILLYKTEEPGAADALGTNRETPVECLKGVRSCSSKKVT